MLRNVFAAFRRLPPEQTEPACVTVYIWHADTPEHDGVAELPGSATRAEAYDIACSRLAQDEAAVKVRVEFKARAFVEAVRKAA
jgi:hypothetical protein